MFDITPVTSEKQFDCGATCLKMLLAYYNIDIDLDELISACNTRITGCSGTDLLRAGRLYGLDDMRAYKMDAAELILQDRPAIIFWMYNHWCIFAGLKDGRVVIINPDRGQYSLSKGAFESFYSGIALFNGEPITMDIPDSSYEQRIAAVEEELTATKIILGVT